MEKNFSKAVLLLCIVMATSCQKMVDDGVDEGGDGEKQNLITFRISQIEQIPFASTELSRATDITKLCSHIYFAVYDSGNKRLQYSRKTLRTRTLARFPCHSTMVRIGW